MRGKRMAQGVRRGAVGQAQRAAQFFDGELNEARAERPAARAQSSRRLALVDSMSDLKPPSQTAPGPAPARRRNAMRRPSTG